MHLSMLTMSLFLIVLVSNCPVFVYISSNKSAIELSKRQRLKRSNPFDSTLPSMHLLHSFYNILQRFMYADQHTERCVLMLRQSRVDRRDHIFYAKVLTLNEQFVHTCQLGRKNETAASNVIRDMMEMARIPVYKDREASVHALLTNTRKEGACAVGECLSMEAEHLSTDIDLHNAGVAHCATSSATWRNGYCVF